MNFPDPQTRAKYAHENAAHECGHMVILFKANRLLGLNFLPHGTADDGVKGVLETDTPTLVREDCVAFAGSLVAELICFGLSDSPRISDDRRMVKHLSGQPLENFAPQAHEIITQNLVFFELLRSEVEKKLYKVLNDAFSARSYTALPEKIPIISLTEVEQIYKRAQSTLAGLPHKA